MRRHDAAFDEPTRRLARPSASITGPTRPHRRERRRPRRPRRLRVFRHFFKSDPRRADAWSVQRPSAFASTLGLAALIGGAALLLHLLRPALRAPAKAPTPREAPLAFAPPGPSAPPHPQPAPPAAPLADPAPSPSLSAAPPAASPASAPLPQGIVAIWHGALPLPLKQFIARQDPDAPVPARLELPVDDDTRLALRFRRINFDGPDAATLLGEVEDHPGGTVVLSHVGNSHAGVIHLPDEQRSYVISGGEDGRVRITATDLTRAPDCAPELPRPPLALLAPQPPPAPSAP